MIRRREKELAAVISMEDRIDAEEARKALEDPGDEAVPWDEAKKDLGL